MRMTYTRLPSPFTHTQMHQHNQHTHMMYSHITGSSSSLASITELWPTKTCHALCVTMPCKLFCWTSCSCASSRVGHIRIYAPYMTIYSVFPCQNYCMYTVYIWSWPTLASSSVICSIVVPPGLIRPKFGCLLVCLKWLGH